ncbi:MAG TPA: Ig-like domain-containing protein [Candidatus Krumholzibacteria bacterium]|nr:Ig-like domain-containing protein [Candidatus Krumholzibacteria bacterium]
MRSPTTFVIVSALALAMIPQAASSYPDLMLSTAPDAYYCSTNTAVGLITVYAVLGGEYGILSASGVSFAAELAAGSDYVYLGSSSPYSVTGDPLTGCDVMFGSCVTTRVNVMTFLLYKGGPGAPCDALRLEPHPSYGEARYTDCQNVTHRVELTAGMLLNSDYCYLSSPPYHPFPADGATDVPLTVALEWSFNLPNCGDISGREDQLYFGTSANPPWFDYVSSPHTIGPLQPGTTYYWKMFVRAYGYTGTSPVWHFTTTGPTAVQQSTWGAIKALYR